MNRLGTELALDPPRAPDQLLSAVQHLQLDKVKLERDVVAGPADIGRARLDLKSVEAELATANERITAETKRF